MIRALAFYFFPKRIRTRLYSCATIGQNFTSTANQPLGHCLLTNPSEVSGACRNTGRRKEYRQLVNTASSPQPHLSSKNNHLNVAIIGTNTTYAVKVNDLIRSLCIATLYLRHLTPFPGPSKARLTPNRSAISCSLGTTNLSVR